MEGKASILGLQLTAQTPPHLGLLLGNTCFGPGLSSSIVWLMVLTEDLLGFRAQNLQEVS